MEGEAGMSQAQLEMSTDTAGDSVHVILRGELDLASAEQADETLQAAEAQGAMLVLDLSQLTFMDSTGLRLILRAVRRCRENGRRLKLISAPPPVQRVFTLTGMEARLPFAAA
jgi:anti-anti-sigma factor